MKEKSQEDINAYLARIRKTIEASKSLVAQAELRMAETDRLLESQGLTREQVKAWSFTPDQLQAANRELERQGAEPFLETITAADAAASSAADAWDASYDTPSSSFAPDEEIDNRRKKFLMMMKPFHI